MGFEHGIQLLGKFCKPPKTFSLTKEENLNDYTSTMSQTGDGRWLMDTTVVSAIPEPPSSRQGFKINSAFQRSLRGYLTYTWLRS
ncbi:hypothetical protein EYZ11_000220 [Aspergillus tanneri]|uniref:Uncharacterized protein n=1 Tax=Aspergillus tanneri TaxID=1220188 RepID=A0A4S3JXQ1_9EURO|nr:hypothetical protein EYZ11_000220 [Aspergillus tanneri]